MGPERGGCGFKEERKWEMSRFGGQIYAALGHGVREKWGRVSEGVTGRRVSHFSVAL